MSRFYASVLGLSLAAASVVVVTSCSVFEASDDSPVAAEAGAFDDGAAPEGGCSKDLSTDSSNCGRCGNACAVSDVCEKSACRPGCAGKIIHVSVDTGSDAQDGCAADRPMKTIGAALARAKAIRAVDHTVAVCRGVYPEAGLVLDYPVSLRGGYECTTFKRTADFGYPKFDPATRTTISDTNTSAQPHITLVVKGPVVTRATTIDGFTITSSPSGASGSVGVVVDTASPTLRDCVVQGGGTTSSTDIGSRGIVSVGGAPEIGASYVLGGTGMALNPSAIDIIGIHIVGGKPFLHDLSVIGSSAPRARAAGMYADGITASGADAWTNLTISSGSVTSSGAGLQVVGKSVLEVARSSIAGPTVTCSNAASDCSAFGVLAGTATLSISSSRIYGGDITGSPAVIHAYYADATDTALTDSVLFAGNGAEKSSPIVSGITVTRAVKTRAAHNTILLREAAGSLDGLLTALWVTNGSNGIDFENNLAIANGPGAPATGIRLDVDCTSPTSSVARVRGNAFVAVGHVLDAYKGGCVRTSSDSIATAETALLTLSPTAIVDSNVRLATDCIADSAEDCRACASSTACGALVSTPWLATSPTIADLFTSPGYAIAAAAPCLVARGGVSLTPAVPTDFSGTKRSGTPSIGAFELTTACTN